MLWFTYTFCLITQHWMIVYKSFSCFTRYIGKSSITNISYTRHGVTKQLVSFVALLCRFNSYMAVPASFLLRSSSVVLTYFFSFFFFSSVYHDDRMFCRWRNRKRIKKRKKKNSFRCLHPIGDKHQWRATEELSLLYHKTKRRRIRRRQRSFLVIFLFLSLSLIE
jgi:hypothetical protein